jgi:hypothetical protein
MGAEHNDRPVPPGRRNHCLSICPACGRDFVVPVTWQPRGETHAWIALRCGGCDARLDFVVTEHELRDFYQRYDRDLARMTSHAQRLRHERSLEEIESLVAAFLKRRRR